MWAQPVFKGRQVGGGWLGNRLDVNCLLLLLPTQSNPLGRETPGCDAEAERKEARHQGRSSVRARLWADASNFLTPVLPVALDS